MKILIIQTAFIGDAILATSLLEKLHSELPEAKLHILVRKGNEAIFENHPYLSRVWIWNKAKHKHRNLRRLIKEVKRYQFDAVLCAQRFASMGLLTMLSGSPIRVGYQKNPLSFFFTKSLAHDFSTLGAEPITHEIERLCALGEHITGSSVVFQPHIYPSESDYKAIEKLAPSSKYITISPASVWFTKAWPPKKWAELIQLLPTDYTIFLLGGKGDQALCQSIIDHARRGVSIAGHLSLLQSAAFMQSATMNYANDSAPTHLASAMAAPITTVFCSTVPEFGYGPLGTNSHVVQHDQPLSCRPCGLHGKKSCPQEHFLCANGIPASTALATLKVS